jgi:glycosyltransferase involved in cell wall biosynthesis
MWRAIERRLQTTSYDAVHFFGGVQVYEHRRAAPNLPAVIVPYESHRRYLQSLRRAASSIVERTRLSLAVSMARAYERVMFEGFDRVVVLTPADRAALLAVAPGSRIGVIPNGVTANDTPRRPDGRTIVFAGNLSYAPNVTAVRRLVSDVLPQVRRACPGAVARIVGGNAPPAVAALAGADVRLTGRVADLAPVFADAALFVAPIESGAGMKNKVLHAMAAGLPVVTTPTGADGLDVTSGEHLVIRRDAPGIAEAVVDLLRQPALAERIGAAGRAFVTERHRWSDVAARYEALYVQIIAERRDRRLSTP